MLMQKISENEELKKNDQVEYSREEKNIHTEDFFEDYIHLHFCTIARLAHLVDSWLWKEN